MSLDQRMRQIVLSSDRGDILERNGNLLATSIDMYSIFVRPRAIKEKASIASNLSNILSEKRALIYEKFKNEGSFWLKRKVPKAVADRILELKCNGIDVFIEKKRVYPKGTLASQLIGVAGMDNQGLSGVELGYDEFLKGREGKYIAERDLLGREIATGYFKEIEPPTEGMNLFLTIDESIQYVAQRDLEEAVKKHGAISGSIIVQEVKTGDILAIAGTPSFDLNFPNKTDISRWKLSPITNVYEPGSTFKMITAASVIEEKLIDIDSIIPCPNSISIGGRIIKNSHTVQYFGKKFKTLRDVIAESINTGTSYIGVKLGKDSFFKHIKDFGFGEYTGINFPGEGRGLLRQPQYWYKSDIAMISFGQTIAVTPIQLISAISAIANDGVKVTPNIVHKVESPDKDIVRSYIGGDEKRIISIETARKLRELMKGVVLMDHGTGHLAKMAQYSCGVKTGTAQKPAKGGGYQEDHYVASIVGFAPFVNPRIAIIVILDDPKSSMWGAVVAAPVFKSVGEFTLRYLNLKADL